MITNILFCSFAIGLINAELQNLNPRNAEHWLPHDLAYMENGLNLMFPTKEPPDFDSENMSALVGQNYNPNSALVRCEFLPDEFLNCGFDLSGVSSISSLGEDYNTTNVTTQMPIPTPAITSFLGSDDYYSLCNQWNSNFPSASSNLASNLAPVCQVLDGIMCYGERRFQRFDALCDQRPGEHHFLTILLYSIFLGFFGVDRYVLGHTETGVGKMLTLGGFGIWWLVDIILLAAGQLVPRDGTGWATFY